MSQSQQTFANKEFFVCVNLGLICARLELTWARFAPRGFASVRKSTSRWWRKLAGL